MGLKLKQKEKLYKDAEEYDLLEFRVDDREGIKNERNGVPGVVVKIVKGYRDANNKFVHLIEDYISLSHTSVGAWLNMMVTVNSSKGGLLNGKQFSLRSLLREVIWRATQDDKKAPADADIVE